MRIWTFEGGYDHNFTYLITGDNSSDAALVDAAVPFTQIKSVIETEQLRVKYLLITHTHGDHTAYARHYLSVLTNTQAALFSDQSFPNSLILQDGNTLTIGSSEITVIHTPGHFPDSVCFLVEGCLFTGDTLFVGRTGRTISPQSDTRQLYQSIFRKILPLPRNTIIYPGHNYGHQPTISLEENIAISPLLNAISEDDFVRRMAEYERSRLHKR
ncbi:MAG: MBL fold metallo-hydrolase [Fidelibacterota bacterium]